MIKGQILSKGIGIGRVLILESIDNEIKMIKVKNIKKEIKRIHNAFKKIITETQELGDSLTGNDLQIIQGYLTLLKDPNLINDIEKNILNNNYCAEYAVKLWGNNIKNKFNKIEDNYIKDRIKDLEDIEKRIIEKLINENKNKINELNKNTIIVSEEITTSEMLKLDLKKVSGIITETGSVNSHFAIIAREHNVPVITNIEIETFLNVENVAIDCIKGEIYLDPSEEEKNLLLKIKNELKEDEKKLKQFENIETVTKDGCKVKLLLNVGSMQDIEVNDNNSIQGIGLVRSEFFFMNRKKIPTEDEQFETYKHIIKKANNKPVIIRTFDIGGDKKVKYLKNKYEANPFLGYRGIRVCLDNIEIFKTQLRSLLKASAYGDLSIMLPMISSVEEVIKAKEILEECKKELDIENILFNKQIKLGIMIETPAASLISDHLAKECDFFSIGTNDLIQYTIAVERGNQNLSKLYTNYHPSVIRLINTIEKNAHKYNIPCCICGEMTEDELMIPLLVGMGIDEFSMNLNSVLKTRKIIYNLEKKECLKLLEEVLNLSSAEEIENRLLQLNKKLSNDRIIKV